MTTTWEYQLHRVLPGHSDDDMVRALNELGQDRWELVSTYVADEANAKRGNVGDSTARLLCLLKRPTAG